MFPIYVCCDSSLNEVEEAAIKRGLREEIIPTFRTKVHYYGHNRWQSGKYKSADLIIDTSFKSQVTGQVDAFSVIEKLRVTAETVVEPGAFVLFTAKDLYARPTRTKVGSSKDIRDTGLNWCMGLSINAYHATVQSVYRYRHLSDDKESFCIRRTLRHEIGHLFGCAMQPGRSNTIDLLGNHCTNRGCSMCQTISVSELVEKMYQEDDHNFLCPQCREDMNRFISGFESDEKRIETLKDAYREVTGGRRIVTPVAVTARW